MDIVNDLKSERNRIAITTILVISISLFHLLFKPFQMAHYSFNDYAFVNIWYFLILSFTVSVHLIFFPKLFQGKFESLLSSNKGLLTLFFSGLITTGVLFFLFKIIFGYYEVSVIRIFTGSLALLAFSIFPFLLFISFKYGLKKKNTTSNQLLISDNFGRLDLSNLLYIYSDKNYVVWVYFVDDIIKQVRVRETLKSVENRLSIHPEIVKTHRAYLANRSQINTVSKSHSSYNIHLKNFNKTIPLSRKHKKSIQEQYP